MYNVDTGVSDMKRLLSNNIKLENRIFNVCLIGMLILCCNNLFMGAILSLNASVFLFNLVIITFLLIMLYIANNNEYKKKYALITCIICNFILFPILYIMNGKIEGGIYFYFLFGMVTTAVTLEKKDRRYALTLEIILQFILISLKQTFISVYDYNILDISLFYFVIVTSFIITSGVLCAILMTILGGYEDKTRELHSLNQYLKEISEIDGLTGLWNRKYMEQKLKEQIHAANTHNRALSIIMYDIDHFKMVNDLYGHQMGDKILKELGKLIRKNIRTNDVAARYGGEEFVIILPSTDEKTAYKIADRIRHIVSKELHIPADMRKITISGGVCTYEKNMELEQFVKIVDENLYKAKETGRNKVVS